MDGREPISQRSSSPSPDNGSGRFILLGGFLGAGKTTCALALGEWLKVRGLRCGFITNDQGAGLVDTALAATGGDVREVTGGCFCCRAGDLIEALRELERDARPDVFIAEPVGSCTDLVATILLPLEQVYRTGLKRAPMSVVLDAKRAWDTYFGRSRRSGGFSKDVRYIYLKQIEEAEILVLNKSDLLSGEQLGRLQRRLESNFPGKKLITVSARTGEGLEAWFKLLIENSAMPAKIMDVDYERYGNGEALMGWYNARLHLLPGLWSVDGNAFLNQLAGAIQEDLEAAGVEIAHFKMGLFKRGVDGKRASQEGAFASISVVRNGGVAELGRHIEGTVQEAELLINLRAESAPEKLEQIIGKRLQHLPAQWMEKAAFRPGKPQPVHRASALEFPAGHV